MTDVFRTDANVSREGPHPIDRHVGLRIRIRRKEMRISQEKLAERLGLTFQQVQKYERGANRVSASRLWEMAQVLKTSVPYFFEGLAENPSDAHQSLAPSVQDFLLTNDGLELVANFAKIACPRVRRKILELVRAMIEVEKEESRTDIKRGETEPA